MVSKRDAIGSIYAVVGRQPEHASKLDPHRARGVRAGHGRSLLHHVRRLTAQSSVGVLGRGGRPLARARRRRSELVLGRQHPRSGGGVPHLTVRPAGPQGSRVSAIDRLLPPASVFECATGAPATVPEPGCDAHAPSSLRSPESQAPARARTNERARRAGRRGAGTDENLRARGRDVKATSFTRARRDRGPWSRAGPALRRPAPAAA